MGKLIIGDNGDNISAYQVLVVVDVNSTSTALRIHKCWCAYQKFVETISSITQHAVHVLELKLLRNFSTYPSPFKSAEVTL